MKRKTKNAILFIIISCLIFNFGCFDEASKMRSLAKKGDKEAQYQLGMIYLKSQKPKQNLEAIEWLKKADEQNQPNAQYQLAKIYYEGKIVSKDNSKYLELLNKSADNGFTEAQLELGNMYYNGNDFIIKDVKKAREYYEKAAQNSNGEAQYYLGNMYSRGEGVKKDIEKATAYYEQSIKNNYNKAKNKLAEIQFQLAVNYATGNGVTKDLKKSFEYFKKSADNGNLEAQYKVGMKYYKGDGITKNSNEAFKYLKQSAEQGNTNAQFLVGKMYNNGEGTNKDLNQAFEWYKKAGEKDHAEAQFKTGMLLESGKLSTTDSNQAREWYKKAAKNGNAEAQCKIGIYYQDVKKDQNEAFEWFKKSAKQGNSEAQYRLGVIYYYNENYSIDEAFDLLNNSAKKGNNKAKYFLGYCYGRYDRSMTHRQLKYSYDTAKYWYKEYFKSEKNPTEEERYEYAKFLRTGNTTDFFEGNSMLTEFAENENSKFSTEAQYELGLAYYNGYKVMVDTDTAKEYFEKAANKGHAKAQYFLGEYYLRNSSDSFSEDMIEKALSWFKKSSEQGYAPATNIINELENPIDRLKFLGEHGNMEAITKLGKMYYDGDGVEQDTDQAFYWFKQAADRGNAKAQFNLGVLYRDKSIDSPMDNYDEQAFRYFLMSAENGDLNGQYAVGRMYELGVKGFRGSGWSTQYVNVIPKDRGKAVYWYKKAAAQGHSKAQEELENLNIY